MFNVVQFDGKIFCTGLCEIDLIGASMQPMQWANKAESRTGLR